MRCNESLQLIDAYVDGQLPERLRAQLDDHLTTCASCSTTARSTRRVAEAARNALEVCALPDDFARRVMNAVSPRPRKGLLWRVSKPFPGRG
jgi:anti-sigma factor RsiW